MIEAPYNKRMQQTVTALAKARPAPAQLIQVVRQRGKGRLLTLSASCHFGAVRIVVDRKPQKLTERNYSLLRGLSPVFPDTLEKADHGRMTFQMAGRKLSCKIQSPFVRSSINITPIS